MVTLACLSPAFGLASLRPLELLYRYQNHIFSPRHPPKMIFSPLLQNDMPIFTHSQSFSLHFCLIIGTSTYYTFLISILSLNFLLFSLLPAPLPPGNGLYQPPPPQKRVFLSISTLRSVFFSKCITHKKKVNRWIRLCTAAPPEKHQRSSVDPKLFVLDPALWIISDPDPNINNVDN